MWEYKVGSNANITNCVKNLTDFVLGSKLVENTVT